MQGCARPCSCNWETENSIFWWAQCGCICKRPGKANLCSCFNVSDKSESRFASYTRKGFFHCRNTQTLGYRGLTSLCVSSTIQSSCWIGLMPFELYSLNFSFCNSNSCVFGCDLLLRCIEIQVLIEIQSALHTCKRADRKPQALCLKRRWNLTQVPPKATFLRLRWQSTLAIRPLTYSLLFEGSKWTPD